MAHWRPSLTDTVRLKIGAAEKAYQDIFYNMYKHEMRYEPRHYQEKFNLSDADVKEISDFEDKQTESELPLRYVVIGLPGTEFPENIKELITRCVRKKYVGNHAYSLELADTDSPHPHVNVVFRSTVAWLAKSRIIWEWAHIFNVAHNYIHVESKPESALKELRKYIVKEHLCNFDNFPNFKK